MEVRYLRGSTVVRSMYMYTQLCFCGVDKTLDVVGTELVFEYFAVSFLLVHVFHLEKKCTKNDKTVPQNNNKNVTG